MIVVPGVTIKDPVSNATRALLHACFKSTEDYSVIDQPL